LLRLGESAIVYTILDFVRDNYLPIVDKITEELVTIEDDIFSTMPATEKNRAYLSSARRTARYAPCSLADGRNLQSAAPPRLRYQSRQDPSVSTRCS